MSDTHDIKSVEAASEDTFGDERQLASLGYKQVLHRVWGQFEGFMAGFGALYVVGGVRILYSIGIYSGGPYALWTSMLATIVFMMITAASLAEICSSVPVSGSIYVWAGAAAGVKYGRFFAFVTAFWACTAWTSFVAGNMIATANFILSEIVIFGKSYPGGVDVTNVKFRALQWGIAEIFLLLCVCSNLLPPNRFSLIFKASALIIAIDFILNLTWLPIGVSKTYGFQSAEFVFKSRYNGTGAGEAWNWILSFLATSGILTGFDASAHIAEETKDASLASARGMFWSCTVAGLMSFPILIVFLFCSPDLETLFGIGAPQPFVEIYDLALGRAGGVVMSAVATIGLIINTCLCITAASRLVFAIARDGIIPGSGWIGKVNKAGQPANAVKFIGIVAGILLITQIPSQVAFTSLVSAGAVPTIAAYALIPLLRLIFTRGDFVGAKWSNGPFSEIFCVISFIWNSFLLIVLLSPYEFPVTAQSFNFACAIFGGVTLMGIVSWWFIPADNWLSRQALAKMIQSGETVFHENAGGNATQSRQTASTEQEVKTHAE